MDNIERVVKALRNSEEEITSALRLKRNVRILQRQSGGRPVRAEVPVRSRHGGQKEKAQYFEEAHYGWSIEGER